MTKAGVILYVDEDGVVESIAPCSITDGKAIMRPATVLIHHERRALQAALVFALTSLEDRDVDCNAPAVEGLPS